MASKNKNYDPKPIPTSTTSCIKNGCFSKDNQIRQTKSVEESKLSQKTNNNKK